MRYSAKSTIREKRPWPDRAEILDYRNEGRSRARSVASGAMKRREPSRLVIGGLGGLESTTRPVRATQYRLVSLIFLHFRSGSIALARPFLVRNRCVNRGPHASRSGRDPLGLPLLKVDGQVRPDRALDRVNMGRRRRVAFASATLSQQNRKLSGFRDLSIAATLHLSFPSRSQPRGC